MNKLLVVIAFLSATAYSQEETVTKELYFVNQAGGHVVLTVEPCTDNEAVKHGFVNRTYATESDGTKHEGCWMPPADISNVEQRPGSTVFAIVNLWYDRIVSPIDANLFIPFNQVKGAI